MQVLIDADGCPVVDAAIKISKAHGVECVIMCDTSHVFAREDVRVITVSKGADSVDFALVNLLKKGDIAITQDYGLAAMCLAKGAVAISQNGMIYNDDNIGALLQQRYSAKKIRMSGGRLKGNAKRTKEQNEEFCTEFEKLFEKTV
ncbi:MAG: YaiI/YqxD family protein [Oscillospiraceae bacterium]